MARQKRTGGRPTALTPAVQKSILKDLVAGASRTAAAQRVGLAYDTFRKWMQRGRAGRKGDAIYVAFVGAVKKAEAEAVCRQAKAITRAYTPRTVTVTKRTTDADGRVREETTSRREFEWTAAAWLLERRHPEDYAANRHEIRDLKKQLADLEALVRRSLGDPEGDPAAGRRPRRTGPDPTPPAGPAGGTPDPGGPAGGPDPADAGGGVGTGPVAGGPDPE